MRPFGNIPPQPYIDALRISLDRKDGCFDSAELAGILLSATESTACAFQACSTPSYMKVIELAAMKRARDWDVCSFNDFRTLLGLPGKRVIAFSSQIRIFLQMTDGPVKSLQELL